MNTNIQTVETLAAALRRADQELERARNETKESVERQTATAEILKVIASSPSDVQPVFEVIVQSASRLFGCNAGILMQENMKIYLRAAAGPLITDGLLEDMMKLYPIPFDVDKNIASRVIANHETVESLDTEAPGVPAVMTAVGRAGHFRSATLTPLQREGTGIGAISITHSQPGFKLNDRQLSLLKTFADQAVIAIENVRLFNETKEALERQTATAEILKVIASSPSDVQPVFEAIVKSARQLIGGHSAVVTRLVGDRLHLAAFTATDDLGIEAVRKYYPLAVIRGNVGIGKAIRTRAPVYILDSQTDQEISPEARELARVRGYRSLLLVPMIREGEVIGLIHLTRRESGPFSAHQISLVKTFADQAVIAIENVRLFKELQAQTQALTRSVGQLTALGEVGQAISSSLDIGKVLKTVVTRAVKLTGLDGGVIYEYDPLVERFELRASKNFDEDSVSGLRGASLRVGEGAVGRSVAERKPIQVHDTHAPDYPARLRELLDREGFRALLAVPLLREDQIIGALLMLRREPGPFGQEIIEPLNTLSSQSALAIQNARLYREIGEKGRQLEEASRHKSQFLASMSHELRTPLNAILGFNEMILDRIYGEVPAELNEPLEDIQKSGKHLLRLINNVLDLAKIEAGRMELALADYSVHDTVESVRSTLRPLAAEKGLEFVTALPDDLPLAYGDFGRITQCLMNLAGNSLKFTKAGKVEISVELQGALLVYRVSDTGMGIPPDKIDSLFTEFKQTDATIASEYGGTGLGLSISRKFIEMHGGRIWVESELGKGSHFIFQVPLRAEKAAA